MTMTDPISDFLTRIRNAAKARHKHVDIPASRVKAELSKILIDAGFLLGAKYIEDGKQGMLRIYLKYDKDMNSVINGMRRVSKPSLRQYVPKKKIPRVLGGYGMAILSTSQGILADRECSKRQIGGEIICEIW
ncbi:MAG: 30S ribosomal protein S8 [Candidatus Latescibacterota bacterium]